MKKLYTEKQFSTYLKFHNEIANESVINENIMIFVEMKDWIEENNLSPIAVDQMDKRMIEEEAGDIPKLRRVK
ncbi:hypothetical protein [Siminovitchia fordii]|uniref:Uncharacterized protein n=1 Tax=Siminovitchia fordii TaxID=254759 RepID=A0ABQ4KA68_9BACI|nr:hypothetical protein [Siminovitchia fordii]GIN22606.1 hypothetical protein J1TS3_37400 [Siminovitchia fordii]